MTALPLSVPDATAQSGTAGQLLQLVNQVRAEHGLAPFRWNPLLAAAAQNQANFNAANGLYGHNGVNGSRPQDRANAAGYVGFVVENVVGGTDLSPGQAVVWWVNSPVHFNTLISTRYSEAGTGYAVNSPQRHYVLVVGRPSDAPPASSSGQSGPEDVPAYVEPIVLSAPAADGSITHEVLTGQTLWAIAARYGVNLEQLRLFNNLAEETFIRPGDVLIIRLGEGQTPPPTPTPPASHRVREGETLWTIAARYRLPLADLLWYNGLSEDSIIRPGDELTVRLLDGQSPPPTATPQLTYRVEVGDSVWVIAARHGLAVEELLTYNSLEAGVILHPGDELWIRPPPTATLAPAAAATAASEAFPETEPAAVSLIPASPPGTSAPQAEPLERPTSSPVITAAAPITEENPAGDPLAKGVTAAAVLTGIGLTVVAGLVVLAVRRDS